MTTIFIGDIGTVISLDVGVDISDATAQKIYYKNSSTDGEWTATLGDDNQSVEYVLQAEDIDVAGKWYLQAYVETPDGKWHGDSVAIVVKESIH